MMKVRQANAVITMSIVIKTPCLAGFRYPPQHSNAKPNVTTPKQAVNPVKFSGFNFCQYCIFAWEKKLHGSRNQTATPTYH